MAVQHVYHHTVLIHHIEEALLGIWRKCQYYGRPPGTAAAAPGRSCSFEADVDVAYKAAHLVEHLDSIRLPVADIDQAVSGQAQTMG